MAAQREVAAQRGVAQRGVAAREMVAAQQGVVAQRVAAQRVAARRVAARRVAARRHRVAWAHVSAGARCRSFRATAAQSLHCRCLGSCRVWRRRAQGRERQGSVGIWSISPRGGWESGLSR